MFHSIEAAEKVGVDPAFQFDITSSPTSVSLHSVTSDQYFGAIADPAEPCDVIFLDGLHTFEQTLRDFTNALAFSHERRAVRGWGTSFISCTSSSPSCSS